MNERSMKLLEFHKIKEQLIEKTETTLGAERAEQLLPSSNLDEAKRWQDETDESAQIIRLNKSLPLGGISDIRDSLKRSKIGGVLSAQQCLSIRSEERRVGTVVRGRCAS